MCNLIASYWTEFIAIVGAVAATWKYFDTRARELRWKRTETLFRLGTEFDKDPDISEAIRLIHGRLDGIHIEQLFDEEGAPHEQLHGGRLSQLDKFLCFLERLAYAYRTMKTLSLDELRLFGAYFQDVLIVDRLRLYCLRNGYEQTVEVAGEI